MLRPMKLIAAVAALLSLATLSASALEQSQVPAKFPIAFGANAGAAYITYPIPTPSQIGIINCRASLTDGFPPLTFTSQNAGGCPPFGQDMNGIFKMLSLWSQWQGAGAVPLYDVSFSSSIGGYPSGATLANANVPGCFWISTADNNTSNPDAGGANWGSSCPGGGVGGTSTGTANSQSVTTTPIALTTGGVPQTGTEISYTVGSGLGNTGALTLNVNGTGNKNFYRISQIGATISVGGETNPGQRVTAIWDGSEWQCTSCGIVHVGKSEDFFGSTALNGTLFEDGSCVSQTTYADLYSVIGTSYGSCPGGQFALPDTRSRVLVGQDTQGTQGAANRLTTGGSGCNAATIGTGCGAQNRSLSSTAQLPQFTPSGSISISGGTFGGETDEDLTVGGSTLSPVVAAPIAATFTGNAIGSLSPSPFTTVQPTLVATKVIQL